MSIRVCFFSSFALLFFLLFVVTLPLYRSLTIFFSSSSYNNSVLCCRLPKTQTIEQKNKEEEEKRAFHSLAFSPPRSLFFFVLFGKGFAWCTSKHVSPSCSSTVTDKGGWKAATR